MAWLIWIYCARPISEPDQLPDPREAKESESQPLIMDNGKSSLESHLPSQSARIVLCNVHPRTDNQPKLQEINLIMQEAKRKISNKTSSGIIQKKVGARKLK